MNAEPLQIRLSVFLIFQPKQPVNDLATSVIKSVRPFQGRLVPLLPENAVARGILEFDEAVLMRLRIANGNVGGVISEDVELCCNSVKVRNKRIVHAHKRDQLLMGCEEREDVLAFFQIRLRWIVQEDPEIL